MAGALCHAFSWQVDDDDDDGDDDNDDNDESTFGIYKRCNQTLSSTIGLFSNSYILVYISKTVYDTGTVRVLYKVTPVFTLCK